MEKVTPPATSADSAVPVKQMREYMANGARFGWLIDPLERRVSVFRGSHTVEVLEDPASLDGEAVLPGFVLHVGELW